MAVPKPIHKYLLGEGFRYVGRGAYYRFLPGKPVAQRVAVDEVEWGGQPGKFIEISLRLVFPDGHLINDWEFLCNDGLLRMHSRWQRLWPAEQFAQALEVLRTTIDKWLDIISNPDVMVAMYDFVMALRDEPPPEFVYTAYMFQGLPKKYEEPEGLWLGHEAYRHVDRRLEEAEASPEIQRAIDEFTSGMRAEPPAGFEDIAWFLDHRKIRRGESFARISDKICYLFLAERYEEAEDILLHNAVAQKFKDSESSRYLRACAQQKIIIVLDYFREGAEKKKLIAPGTWKSVPAGAFADAAQDAEADAGEIEDICAIFFSGGRKAAAAFVQARYGMDITGQRGKRVVDALDAAGDADEGQFILCAPSRRWNVLMGDVALADPEADDGISAQLSAASKTTKDGQVLLIGAQDTAGVVWFEYHKGGELKRRWACAEGEVLSNDGAPLNDFDARTFGAEIGEDGAPESGTLAVLAEKITGIAWDALQKPGALFELECKA